MNNKEGSDITHVDDDVGWVWGIASFPGLCSICCLQHKILCEFCVENDEHYEGLGEFCTASDECCEGLRTRLGGVCIY